MRTLINVDWYTNDNQISSRMTLDNLNDEMVYLATGPFMEQLMIWLHYLMEAMFYARFIGQSE